MRPKQYWPANLGGLHINFSFMHEAGINLDWLSGQCLPHYFSLWLESKQGNNNSCTRKNKPGIKNISRYLRVCSLIVFFHWKKFTVEYVTETWSIPLDFCHFFFTFYSQFWTRISPIPQSASWLSEAFSVRQKVTCHSNSFHEVDLKFAQDMHVEFTV